MFPSTSIETKLDAEINSLLDKLKETTKDSEDYSKILDRIAKLHKLKTDEQTSVIDAHTKADKMESDRRIKPPSLDNVLVVSANIFGIWWITRYEKERVLNTKALPQIMKPR